MLSHFPKDATGTPLTAMFGPQLDDSYTDAHTHMIRHVICQICSHRANKGLKGKGVS